MTTTETVHTVHVYDLDPDHPPYTAAPRGPYAARCSCGFMSKPTENYDDADQARGRHYMLREFDVDAALALGRITAEVAATIIAARDAQPCDFCEQPTQPDAHGDWINCPNDPTVCIDCCPCH